MLSELLFLATASVYTAACVLFVAFLQGRAEHAARWAPRLVAVGVTDPLELMGQIRSLKIV